MVYGYVRVSTGKQDKEAQVFGVQKYAKESGLSKPKIFNDTASGTIDWRKRDLGKLIEKAKEGDTIIFPEISRIARTMLQILEVQKACAEKKINVHIAKERLIFDNTIASIILTNHIGTLAQIQRMLISQRTKEALAARQAQGVKLGRPVGSTSINPICEEHHDEIIKMLEANVSKAAIARLVGVHRNTLAKYVKSKIQKSKK